MRTGTKPREVPAHPSLPEDERKPEESLLTSGPPYQKFGAPRRIPEPVAREVRARRAAGESLRQISQRMNLKLGAVRSVLKRDRTPPPESAASASTAAVGA